MTLTIATSERSDMLTVDIEKGITRCLYIGI